jgi:quercetin dioxygenase-like cupin family protein
MKLFRSADLDQLAAVVPETDPGLSVNWLEGPVAGPVLDLGVATLTTNGAAPPHAHRGGQVIIVLSGEGFVENDTERIEIGPGDVVFTPPGEMHTHGARGLGPLAHLTVTTGGFDLPEPA